MTTSRATPTSLADDLAYYRTPGVFTSIVAHAAAVDALPGDVASLARVVENVLVHRFWMQAYGLAQPSPERDREQGLHGADAMLTQAMRLSDAPLGHDRAADTRVLGICRHFAVLLCALLRHKGVPARARCGFSTYFQPGKSVDHWVCEYWHEGEQRWVMVDAQVDALQRSIVKPDFDPLDVPRDRFLVAGDAWSAVRRGDADGAAFGIAHMWGGWFIRGNLLLDAASLNKIELLPWEPWLSVNPPEAPDAVLDALCDELAALSSGAGTSMADLRDRYARDDVRAPDTLIATALRADIDGPIVTNSLTFG